MRHGVDVVFSGHDHIYQRGEHGGLRYIVSGGGGASLYAVRCGVPGKPTCAEDGMQKVAKEHHYVVVSVEADVLVVCARRADGSLLEACQRWPRWRP